MKGAGQEVAAVRGLVEAASGVGMSGHLAGRLEAHMESEVARLGLGGTPALLDLIRRGGGPGGAALDRLLAAVLVHETFFYRFRSQLVALEAEIGRRAAGGRGSTLRIWSAGCSRGPEPYTIAMLALRASSAARRRVQVDVLGTDVCESFLEAARAGVYAADRARDLPPDLRSLCLEDAGDGRVRVTRAIRSSVRFVRHNLLDPPPGRDFDVVCCRNVLIYFDEGTRLAALARLASALSPGGLMLVGHSESLRDVPDLFSPAPDLGLGIYRARSAPSLECTSTFPPSPRASRAPLPRGRGAAGTAGREVGGNVKHIKRERRSTVPPPAAIIGASIELTGEYDAARTPERIAALKALLGEAIDGGPGLVIVADPAVCLDEATGRLVARAARLASSRGGSIVVRASRQAVRRWAERYGLPLEPPAGGGAP